MTTPSYFPLPVGTTDQRPPDPQAGYIRFNTTVGKIEVYNGQRWTDVIAPSLRRIRDIDEIQAEIAGDEQFIIDQLTSIEAQDYTTYRISLNDLLASEPVEAAIKAISEGVTDVENLGGFGQLTYDTVTNKIYYQGVISSEIRGVMGVDGSNLSYNSGTGKYSFTLDPVFDSITTVDLYVENVTFTGTGAINISSNNDLNLDARGRIIFKNSVHLPVYTRAELADLTDITVGAVAVCSDPVIGQARPVQFDGTYWKDFLNGDIDGVADDF